MAFPFASWNLSIISNAHLTWWPLNGLRGLRISSCTCKISHRFFQRPQAAAITYSTFTELFRMKSWDKNSFIPINSPLQSGSWTYNSLHIFLTKVHVKRTCRVFAFEYPQKGQAGEIGIAFSDSLPPEWYPTPPVIEKFSFLAANFATKPYSTISYLSLSCLACPSLLFSSRVLRLGGTPS